MPTDRQDSARYSRTYYARVKANPAKYSEWKQKRAIYMRAYRRRQHASTPELVDLLKALSNLSGQG